MQVFQFVALEVTFTYPTGFSVRVVADGKTAHAPYLLAIVQWCHRTYDGYLCCVICGGGYRGFRLWFTIDGTVVQAMALEHVSAT